MITSTISERGFCKLNIEVNTEMELQKSLNLLPNIVCLSLNLQHLENCDVSRIIRDLDFSFLKRLKLSYAYKRVTFVDLDPSMFPALNSLEFDDFKHAHYFSKDLNAFINGLRTLKKLTLIGCCYKCFKCNSNTVETLVLCCYHFDKKELKSIEAGLPNLRHLQVQAQQYGEMEKTNDSKKRSPRVPVDFLY